METLQLHPIARDGQLPAFIELDDLLRSVVAAMIAVYEKSGFQPPWIGYVATRDGTCVGTCAFKSPPAGGKVEIAYFTLPGHEGQGVATAMVKELVQIARRAEPSLVVTAQTLPEQSASTAILKKLGFRFVGQSHHPEDGTVWEWKF